jgi:hypothetical protein
MGFSLLLVETNKVRSARETSRRNGFVSDDASGPKGPPLHRPAGTREALPGTIAGLAPRYIAPQLENELRIALRFSAKI